MDITRINKQWQVRISLCAQAHHNCAVGSTIALIVPLPLTHEYVLNAPIAAYIQNISNTRFVRN